MSATQAPVNAPWATHCDPSPVIAARKWPGPSFVSPQNAFCVTLYNEGCELLHATLLSLVRAIRFCHCRPGSNADFSTICVVADGLERLDGGVAKLLVHLGVAQTGPWQFRYGVDVHYSMHDCAALLEKLGDTAPRLELAPVRFILCIKEHNRGKLHSHVLFFDDVCRKLHPTYCFQVDTGTVVAESSVALIVDRMERSPELAALAPRVLPAAPRKSGDLLQHWQYFDFAYRKGVSWPFEVAAGFLSVVPGQVSAFRWTALCDSERASDEAADDGEPLSAYLHGPRLGSALSRLMYLAEDRVIGAQLVLARCRQWELDYLPDAAATTDACNGFHELLRQRRRWNNSATACRVWLARQVPRFMSRADRSSAGKLRFLIAVSAQSVLALRELLAPALLFALLLVLWPATAAPWSSSQGWLAKVFWLATAMDLALGLARGREQSKHIRWIGPLHASVGILCAVCYVSLVLTLPPLASALLLVPAIALIPMMWVLGHRGAYTLIRMQLSPITGLAMFCLVLVYSMFNLDDVSWGTKGLHRPLGGAGGARALKRLRNVAFPAWITANLALAVAAFSSMHVADGSLNAVIAASCVIDAFLAAIAAAHLMRRRWFVGSSASATGV